MSVRNFVIEGVACQPPSSLKMCKESRDKLQSFHRFLYIKLTYESCLSSMENVRQPPTGETFGKCQKLMWIRIQYSRYNRFFNVWLLGVRNKLKPYYTIRTEGFYFHLWIRKKNKHHPKIRHKLFLYPLHFNFVLNFSLLSLL